MGLQIHLKGGIVIRFQGRTQRLIAIVAGIALLVTPVPASAADSAAVQSAKHFREGFGLRADTAYVESSLTDSERFSNTDWGLPLSAAEVEDLTARLVIQKALPPVINYAMKQPGYAGAFIDQLEKGMPVFLFTKGIAAQSDDRCAPPCLDPLRGAQGRQHAR